MARRHYWQFLVTDEGNPIENAQISIYTAGTTDPVYIYTDEVGATSTNADPQTQTSRKGYFEFWIADENETNGYPYGTKFKIAWSAAGVSDGYIDYVDVFSIAPEPVDETDTNTLRNKAVSNALAKGWEDHSDAVMPADAPVHGIDILVESDATSYTRNKVISNYQGFIWDYHTRTIINSTTGVIEPTSVPIGTQIEDMHGIEQVDATFTATDTLINKLVSNEMAKRWDDHATNVSGDPHPQYMPIEGRTGTYPNTFIGLVGYSNSTITDSAGANDFITKGYISGLRHEDDILTADWNDNLDGTYSFVVVHNLNANYPMVSLWDTSLAKPEMVIPLLVENEDADTITVTITNDNDHYIRVIA